MKLETKLTLLTTAAVLLVSFFSFMLMDRLLRERTDYELQSKGQILGESLSEAIARDVINLETLRVTDVLNKIVERTQHVSYAYVFDFDGKIFAHTFKKGFPQTLLADHHHCENEVLSTNKYLLEGKTIVEVSYPFVQGMKAHVHIGMDESYHLGQYSSLRTDMLSLAAIVIFVGILLSFLISRQISNPLRKLSKHVNAFGEGALTETIEINHTAPEIFHLTQTFNQMITSRIEAEEYLVASEERFRQLAENIREVFWLGSPDWRKIFYISPAYEEIWGKSCDSLYAQPLSWFDPLPEEDKKTIQAFLQEKIEVDFDEIIFPKYRLMQSDGSTRWIAARAYPIRDSSGRVFRIAGIAEDITEQKRNDEYQQINEKRFKAIMDSMDSLIYVADMESYELLFLNKYGRDIWGEITGKPCWKALQADRTGPCSFCTNEKLVAADGTSSGVYIWELQNTVTQEWYECRDQAILWPDGRLVRMEMATNITKRKKAKNNLLRVNRALMALSNVNNAVIKTDNEEDFLLKICDILVNIGRYRFAWIAFAENDEEKTVRPVSSAGFEVDYLKKIRVSWADNEYGQGPTGSSIRTGETYIVKDILNDPGYNQWKEEAQLRGYASSIALPLKTEHGTFGALNVYSGTADAFDIEEIKLLKEMAADLSFGITTLRAREEHKKAVEEKAKLQEQLYQAQKMESIGTLAGGIAHDFNNILSAIIGFTELARMDLPVETQATQDLAEVLNASNRAKELVQQILTFSRKSDPECKPLNIQSVVTEALKLLRSSIPSTIEIEQDIDMTCGYVSADPTQIHQIVMNLCTNAYHAMERTGGTLQITLRNKELQAEEICESGVSPGPFVVLSVSDTGYGMDKKTMGRIFEPYFTTKGMEKGTGLGLAVIYGIVQDYAGFIKVESEPGKGTSFHVHFPILKTNNHSEERPKEKVFLAQGSERILIVDDDPFLTRITKRYLENMGYTCAVTTDSQEALDIFRATPGQFDLLITDQTMPRLTGSELSEKILEIRPSMPIILCTGHSDIVSENDALAMGIKKYVLKPIQGDELLNAVREVLSEK